MKSQIFTAEYRYYGFTYYFGKANIGAAVQ